MGLWTGGCQNRSFCCTNPCAPSNHDIPAESLLFLSKRHWREGSPACLLFRESVQDGSICYELFTQMTVSITIISDTHLRHRELHLGSGDLLIHCGDMLTLATRDPAVIGDIDSWFGRQKFDRILCVGGNHDYVLQDALKERPQPFKNAHYLQDANYRFAELNIYGSPWVPGLPNQAFSRDAMGLADAWSRIPHMTDILITHTPPSGVLDRSSRGASYGCPILAAELNRIAPQLHCFGHVHASAGQMKIGHTTFVNASSIESGTGQILTPITVRF